MILDFLKLPEKAIPQLSNNNRIPVKQLIEIGGFTGSEKRIIEKSIAMFQIKAIINEHSSSIWAYKDEIHNYEEVQIFLVELKTTNDLTRLNELLHNLFPNPCLFVYQIGEKYTLSTALKRINKIDLSKSVIESIELSNLFALDEKHISLLNKFTDKVEDLKQYYYLLNNIVAAEEVLNLTGNVPSEINESIKLLAHKIKNLIKQKKELESQLREADSMQEKMTIHMNIKKLDNELGRYING